MHLMQIFKFASHSNFNLIFYEVNSYKHDGREDSIYLLHSINTAILIFYLFIKHFKQVMLIFVKALIELYAHSELTALIGYDCVQLK